MDTHRFRRFHGARPQSAQISGTNFKTTVAIGLGVVTLFTGIILIVAFGLPGNIAQKPQSISGALVCTLGVSILFVGSVYAYMQNRKKKRRQQARTRLMKVRTLAQVAPAFKRGAYSSKIAAAAHANTASSPTQISLVQMQSSTKLHRFSGATEDDDGYNVHGRY